MEHKTSNAVLSAFDWGREGGTAESCMTCKKLLVAAHQIAEYSKRRRDELMETGQASDTYTVVAELGSLVDILSDPRCEDHKTFFRSVLRIKNDDSIPQTETLDQHGTLELHWDSGKGHALLANCFFALDLKFHMSTSEQVILLESESDDLGLSCMARLRDSDFINVGLIKEWISTCQQFHTRTCCEPTSPSTSLSWMIDTISGCLVAAEKATRYVALSYVWGQTEMLRTTIETLDALQEVGALDEKSCPKISPVIRHAIALVPQLGERYLWVDALCIPQDDPECLQRHIRHMASIYEAAVFTIVAADGTDANHGIPGLRGISAARKVPPFLQLTSRLRLRPRLPVKTQRSPWGKRGWTFQEQIFSRKKLIFVQGSVQWICQECQCFEDVCEVSQSLRKTKIQGHGMDEELGSVGELAVQYPMISQLETLVSQYTYRDLTHQYDALNAVDAVFTAHHGAFPHGFFWGLPVDFFDIALLWSSFGGKRRQAFHSASQSAFPSWTWAGWVGQILSKRWSASSYIKQAHEHWGVADGNHIYQTIPICEWRQRSNPESPESLIPGLNSAYSYKQRFMGKKDGLPHGWKYNNELFGPDREEDTWWMDRYPGSHLMTPYYYSHEVAPGVKFWHPVPISLDPPKNKSTAPTSDGLIFAKTRSGRGWAVKAWGHPETVRGKVPIFGDRVHLFGGEFSPGIVLTNQKGELVGYMEIDDKSDRDLVEKYKRRPEEAGYPCELVAISRANDFVHPMEPGKEEYTFYNVLWVKWEDGIAYRRGVGHIKRETWESMELEDVDLVLG